MGLALGSSGPTAEEPALRARPHVTVTTAGHVDHGKSTLVRALTGQDPDRLAEEQRRGLTIELGFVWCTLPGTSAAPEPIEVAFVDVPGHERFVATALAGVGPASGTVLVVAADDGWSAQTQEHAELLRLLERPVLLTVLSKAATVDAARLAEVAADVERRLAALGLAGAPTLPVDAVRGEGLDDVRTHLRDALAALPPSDTEEAPRLWIDRVFTRPGAGTVVTGTLLTGALRVGDEVLLHPSGRRCRLRGLASLGTAVDVANAGERVACNLAGVGLEEVVRGDAVVGGSSWRSTATIDGWLTPIEDGPPLARGAWQVHVGTARCAARLVPVPGRPDVAGQAGAVRLLLDRPVPVRSGDVVVVREDGRRRTVARVVVVDPYPDPLPRGGARRQARAELLHRLVTATTAERWRGLVELAGGRRDRGSIVAATGDEPTQVDGLVRVGDLVVLEQLLGAARAGVLELGPGVHERGAVLRSLHAAGLDGPAGDAVLDALVDGGELVVRDGGFVLPTHLEVEVDERAARRALLLERLVAGGLAPPPLDELLREVGADARDVAALVRDGAVARLGSLTVARRTVDDVVATLRASDLAGRGFTAAQARDVLGSSRRVVIPLLEHLARTGITSFDGQHHRLREVDGSGAGERAT